jgi:hypothetical protein
MNKHHNRMLLDKLYHVRLSDGQHVLPARNRKVPCATSIRYVLIIHNHTIVYLYAAAAADTIDVLITAQSLPALLCRHAFYSYVTHRV